MSFAGLAASCSRNTLLLARMSGGTLKPRSPASMSMCIAYTDAYSSASTDAVQRPNPPSAFWRERNTPTAELNACCALIAPSFWFALPNSGRCPSTTAGNARLVICSVHRCGKLSRYAMSPLAITSGNGDTAASALRYSANTSRFIGTSCEPVKLPTVTCV